MQLPLNNLFVGVLGHLKFLVRAYNLYFEKEISVAESHRSKNMLDYFGKLLGATSGLLSLGLVLFISLDVLLRYLKIPMSGALEISRLVLGWICFCSIVFCYLKDSHVRVTLVIDKLSPRRRAIAEGIACLLGGILMFSAFFTSVRFFWESVKVLEIFSLDIPLPYWLAKLSVPVGTLIFALLFLYNLIRQIRLAIAEKE